MAQTDLLCCTISIFVDERHCIGNIVFDCMPSKGKQKKRDKISHQVRRNETHKRCHGNALNNKAGPRATDTLLLDRHYEIAIIALSYTLNGFIVHCVLTGTSARIACVRRIGGWLRAQTLRPVLCVHTVDV